MIWALRSISIHLWITTLCAIPFNFYVLPRLTQFFPRLNPVITGLLTILIIALVLVLLLDRLTLKVIKTLIKEGQAWERSGILSKAQKSYIKALRLYDTFLLWPFSAKKSARIISGAMARFKLNTSSDNQNFKLATAVYLKINPLDEEISRLWLIQLRQSNIISSLEQEVLSVLGEKHYANTLLSSLMVDIFLELGRKDFIAKKLYSQIEKDPALEAKYSDKIENLIGKLDGDTLQQEVSFIEPKANLKQQFNMDSVTSMAVRANIKLRSRHKTKFEPGKYIQKIVKKLFVFFKVLWEQIGSVLSFLIISVSKIFSYIKEHERAQFYLKMTFIGMISVWFLFFMITTMSHMFKSKVDEKQKVIIKVQVPKPFTIQVAAYLTQKHADRYIAILKKKGIDAIVKKVGGGGKIWFVIRVSEFIDKKSATAYGNKLKQEKIIDDFFVNNK